MFGFEKILKKIIISYLKKIKKIKYNQKKNCIYFII